MFGRKKSKDERKKKHHKPSMSQADLSKLEEVGIRRGFFSKIGKKDKDDHDGNSQSASVLQKATKYGSVVRRMSSTSDSPESPHHKKKSASGQSISMQRPQSMQIPASVVPVASMHAQNRNSYYHSSTTSSTSTSVAYDVPKAPVRKSKSKPSSNDYDIPRSSSGSSIKNSLSAAAVTKPTTTTRLVTLKKRSTGDFGLSLRRSTIVEYNGVQPITKTVFFAEPGAAMFAEAVYDENSDEFLHMGDRLIEIDGVNVESALREEVVNRIKSAGSIVRLLVVKDDNTKSRIDSPLARREATSKNSTKTSTSQLIPNDKLEVGGEHPVKMEAGFAAGVKWIKKEEVWLKLPSADNNDDEKLLRANIVVPDQSAGDAVGNLREGKCRVQVCNDQQNIEIYIANDEDVEHANTVGFDSANDLATLRHLNESSFLRTMASKHEKGLDYTYIGPHLLSVAPSKQTPIGRSVKEKQRGEYKQKRSQQQTRHERAHIYSMAQHAYVSMMNGYHDQAIVNIGVNSATTTGQQLDIYRLLDFLVCSYTANNNLLNEDKVEAMQMVLKSLTWTSSSSRCIFNHQLTFTKSGQLKSWSIQTLLFDHLKVVERSFQNPNFDLFYQIYFGADSQMRKDLLLGGSDERKNPILFGKFEPDDEMIVKYGQDLNSFVDALCVFGFSLEQQKAIFHIVAVCIHLGMAGCRQVNENKVQFEFADHAQKAASLLGTSTDQLCSIVFQTSNSGGSGRSTMRRQNSSFTQSDDNNLNGSIMLNSFICNLYKEMLHTVVSCISRSLNCKELVGKSSIYLLDSPGYNKGQAGNNISDFTFNYIQDRLNALFYHRAVTASKDRYLQEGIQIDVNISDNEDSLSSGADIVDKPIVQLRGKPSKGIFRIIEEETNSTAEELIDRIHSNASQNKNEAYIVQRSGNKKCFIFRHHNATCPIEYNVDDWLQNNRLYSYHEQQSASIVANTLKNSKKYFISELFSGKIMNQQLNSLSHNSSGTSETSTTTTSTLRRVSSFKKTFSSSTQKSYCGHVKIQVDNMIDRLSRTNMHFILAISTKSPSSSSANLFSYKFVRQQLQGFRLLDISRIHKQGFPENMVMSEFGHRFAVLCDATTTTTGANMTNTISDNFSKEQKLSYEIVTGIEMDASQYRIGISEIFFRSGSLDYLYGLRDDKISARILLLQSKCRGYLARKRFEKRKVQDVAIRCLQRNIRLFMSVRKWPWWKLVTKILPLVEVNRAEDELREKQAELDLLKEKYERVCKEKEDVEQTNENLEHKMEEIMQLLEEEQATAARALELLDTETKEKVKFQKDNQELHEKVDMLEEKVKNLESEAANYKKYEEEMERKSSIILSSDDDCEGGIDYKLKYEKALRDHKFKMKEKMREDEDLMEELRENKKALERKLIQMNEEIDEHVRIEKQNKNKTHKLQSELGDVKIHLEEITTNNKDLEKKQRKVDSELNALHKEISELKSSRDRFQREKDRFAFDNNSIAKELEDKNEELELAMNKVAFLEQELDETQLRDTDDKQMLNKLKKKVRDLEAKVADQEEELDEQAGTIQTLEQAKERLEMSSDQLRSNHQREIVSKDEEFDEFRISYQKKVKALEEQLQEADDDRTSHVRQRRQLEQQIFELKENGAGGGGGLEYEKQLRRDVKRYKSLLHDSQTMIDHLKTNAVKKQQLRQLSTKLAESEYSCAAAVKSRKAMELEIEDLQNQLEEISRSKQESESRVSSLQHRVHALQSQIEEDTEDSSETMTKYKNLISLQADDQRKMVELVNTVDELKMERNSLEEQVAELQSQIDRFEESSFDRANYNRLEAKVKDFELKLDYQKTSCRRLEIQLTRAKENNDRVTSERDSQAAIAQREREAVKRVNKQLRETKEEQAELLKKEQDAIHKKHQLELELEEQSNQIESLQADLKLAFRRIENLQTSVEEMEDSDLSYVSSSDQDDDMTSQSSDNDDYSSSRRSRQNYHRTPGSPRKRITSSSSYSSNLPFDDNHDEQRIRSPIRDVLT